MPHMFIALIITNCGSTDTCTISLVCGVSTAAGICPPARGCEEFPGPSHQSEDQGNHGPAAFRGDQEIALPLLLLLLPLCTECLQWTATCEYYNDTATVTSETTHYTCVKSLVGLEKTSMRSVSASYVLTLLLRKMCYIV